MIHMIHRNAEKLTKLCTTHLKLQLEHNVLYISADQFGRELIYTH